MPQKHGIGRDFSRASSFLAAGTFPAGGKETEDGSESVTKYIKTEGRRQIKPALTTFGTIYRYLLFLLLSCIQTMKVLTSFL
jgi:hypothetical protein